MNRFFDACRPPYSEAAFASKHVTNRPDGSPLRQFVQFGTASSHSLVRLRTKFLHHGCQGRNLVEKFRLRKAFGLLRLLCTSNKHLFTYYAKNDVIIT